MKTLLMVFAVVTSFNTANAAKSCDTNSGQGCTFFGVDGAEPVTHGDTRTGKVTGTVKTCCNGSWVGGSAGINDGFSGGGITNKAKIKR